MIRVVLIFIHKFNSEVILNYYSDNCSCGQKIKVKKNSLI